MKYLNRAFLIEIGGHLVALLLPLYLNPFFSGPLELAKVSLFKGITMGMLIALLLSPLLARLFRHTVGVNRASLGLNLAEISTGNPLLLPTLAYAGAYLIATFSSIDPRRSFWGSSAVQGMLMTLILIIFFLLISGALVTSAQINRIITSLLLGSVPVALYGWVQYIGLDPLIWRTTSFSPVHSTVGYSLYLGAYLAMIIPFTLSRILGGQVSGQRKRPIPYIFVLFLQLTCLLFTLSRGAWLGVLGGSLLFLLLLAYQWRWRSLMISVIVVLLSGTYLFTSMNKGWVIPIADSFSESSDNQLAELRLISNNERLILWRYTLPMLPKRFLVGYGPDTFASALQMYYPAEVFQALKQFHSWDPHNMILNLLVATGILGFLAFFWILFRFYQVALSTLRSEVDQQMMLGSSAILSSVTAYLIQAQFNPNGMVPTALFWLILAFSSGLYKQNRQIT